MQKKNLPEMCRSSCWIVLHTFSADGVITLQTKAWISKQLGQTVKNHIIIGYFIKDRMCVHFSIVGETALFMVFDRYFGPTFVIYSRNTQIIPYSEQKMEAERSLLLLSSALQIFQRTFSVGVASSIFLQKSSLRV